MKIVLLAAGSGTRLMPYTQSKPKCLVEIKNRPLLSYQLEVLNKFHFCKMIAVTGHCSNQMTDKTFVYLQNEQFKSTNMVWSLYCAREELNSAFILTYGDIVYSPQIIKQLLDDPADIAVAVDQNWKFYWSARFENPLGDAESLTMTHDARITSIGRKTQRYDDIEGQFMGLVKFSSRGTSILCNVLDDCFENKRLVCGKAFDKAYTTDLIQEIIDRGHDVKAVVTDEPWIEIDSTKDLLLTENHIRLDQITAKLNTYVPGA